MKKHHALITAVLIATLSPVTAYADNPGTLMKDVNFDGVINAVDASMVLTEYAKSSVDGEVTFDKTQRYIADANHDGQVTAVDASYILGEYAMRSAGEPVPIETVIFTTESGYMALTVEDAERHGDNVSAEITIHKVR